MILHRGDANFRRIYDLPTTRQNDFSPESLNEPGNLWSTFEKYRFQFRFRYQNRRNQSAPTSALPVNDRVFGNFRIRTKIF